MKWRMVLEPDLEMGNWAIWCLELPGCVSAGDTQEEAIETIQEAIELYLELTSIKLAPGAIIREISIG